MRVRIPLCLSSVLVARFPARPTLREPDRLAVLQRLFGLDAGSDGVAALFAGIDVAKDTLAVALSSGREWSCRQRRATDHALVERLEGFIAVAAAAWCG